MISSTRCMLAKMLRARSSFTDATASPVAAVCGGTEGCGKVSIDKLGYPRGTRAYPGMFSRGFARKGRQGERANIPSTLGTARRAHTQDFSVTQDSSVTPQNPKP